MITAKEFEALHIDEDGEVTLSTGLRVALGEWEIYNKNYASKKDVWFVEPQYFRVTSHRSGNYYSGGEYKTARVEEVETIEVTTIQYKALNNV